MRITIIPSDNAVYVDDLVHQVDLSSANIPTDVHALQWFDTKGWIEFSDGPDPFMPKPPNEEINSLPTWANNCVTLWEQWIPPVVAPEVAPEYQPTTTGTQTI